MGTISSISMHVRLLTYKTPHDLTLEAAKFLTQFNHFTLEIRRSKEFHDRFIILDDIECWHIGCSIKDAGNKAFMLSKIEDQVNRNALITELNKAWLIAEVINL